MMFALDTNVVSELREVRLGKADTNLTAWAESVDAAVAQRCARQHIPDMHGMTVVTRNVADFKPTGVPLINPWEVSQ